MVTHFGIFSFLPNLQIDIFEGADFKYGNSFFYPTPKIRKEGIFCLKYQKRHFWSKIQAFLLLCEILQLSKFKNAAFKYDVIVL